MKMKRLIAILLAVVLALGLIPLTSIGGGVAYAEGAEDEAGTEPTWPYLKSIDEYTFSNANLRTDFPEPKDNLKKIEIQHKSTPVENSKSTVSKKIYDVGTIVLYVETLPTEADKSPTATGTNLGFKFQIGKDASNNPKITVSGDYSALMNFLVTNNLNVSKNFYESKNATSFYSIMAEDGTYYHYDVKVVQYVEETEDFNLAGGSATRNSKEQATVTFTSTQTGSCFYKLYDSPQDNLTADDLITSGGSVEFGSNTLTLTDLSSSTRQYLYVVGKTADGATSNILEIVIPGITFRLQHEKQGLRGLCLIKDSSGTVDSGWLYTEQFTDASGNEITEAVPGDQVTVKFGAFAINSFTPLNTYYDEDANVITNTTGIRRHVLKQWNITGVDGVSPDTETSFTFTMPENDVTIQAETELSGVPIYLTSGSSDVSATLNCRIWNESSQQYNASACYYSDGKDCLVAGTRVKLSTYNIAVGYDLDKWLITNNNVAVDESKISYDEDNNPILTLEEGGDYVFTATFFEKAYAAVEAAVNDSTMGTATVSVDDGDASSRAYPVYEGQTVTLTATSGERYVLDKWEVKDTDGTEITYTVDMDAAPNVATFTMPDTGKNITAKAIFKVDPTKASDKKELLSVTLCSAEGTSIGSVSTQGIKRTITLPADTDVSKLSEMTLKLTASDYATIRKSGDTEDWPAEGKACGMTLDQAMTFTVTAENGDTQNYTITIIRAKSSECAIESAKLGDVVGILDQAKKTVTFMVPADTEESAVAAMPLKFTCSQYASIKVKGVEENWVDGASCNMALNEEKTFVVMAEDGTSTAEYTVVIHRQPSDKKTLTEATLGKVSAAIDETEHTVSFTVPSDTDNSKLSEMILKFTCSPRATIKLKDAESNWPAAGLRSGLKLGVPATFVVTAEDESTQEYTLTVIREKSTEKAVTEAVLTKADGTSTKAVVNNEKKTVTFTLPAGTTDADVAAMTLKFTCSQYASIKLQGETSAWPDNGQLCGMKLNEEKTFVVTAENGDTQAYTALIVRGKSTEKEITAAVLLNSMGDTTPLASAVISGTSITFTLPEDTDSAVLSSIGTRYLKLTYPESASVAMADGYSDANGSYKWRNGDVMCNMSLNTPASFTVTAEDGSTKEYTVEIKYTAPAAPTLSDGSATRTGKTAATVTFTSSEAGSYYYKLVTKGAAAPTIVTTGSGDAASAGSNTITLTNLTEDARDIYIVVKSADGVVSDALKVEIPAYSSGGETTDEGAYTITYSGPKGGKLVPSRTKADKGDTITVTVSPDSGYQMVSGSMTYTLAVSGGATVKITGNQFTMPAGDVTLSCQWETATTTASTGITAFSINGVSAAVNNTTNVITITMPRGTDVTKLTPVIATSGVKSLSPASGKTVDFTNSVTYTATMDDGSVKTYTVTVYVDKGTLADQFWDKLTDFYNQIPWWEYAKQQQSSSKYPKYW